jgi:hypothetical protein
MDLGKRAYRKKENRNSFIICILLPNTVRAIKLKRMRWLGHSAYMGDMGN